MPCFICSEEKVLFKCQINSIRLYRRRTVGENFNCKEKVVQLILDSSRFQILLENPEYLKIVKATTDFCHNLHVARIQKLS